MEENLPDLPPESPVTAICIPREEWVNAGMLENLRVQYALREWRRRGFEFRIVEDLARQEIRIEPRK